jgi:hypothetical protein
MGNPYRLEDDEDYGAFDPVAGRVLSIGLVRLDLEVDKVARMLLQRRRESREQGRSGGRCGGLLRF